MLITEHTHIIVGLRVESSTAH